MLFDERILGDSDFVFFGALKAWHDNHRDWEKDESKPISSESFLPERSKD